GHAEGAEGVEQSQAVEGGQGVAPERQPRAHLLDLRGALVNRRLDPDPPQGDGGRQSTDPTADDDRRPEWTAHHCGSAPTRMVVVNSAAPLQLARPYSTSDGRSRPVTKPRPIWGRWICRSY